MTRVLLADDQAVVRAGLRTILESAADADLDIVGEAADGAEAVALTTALQPDVVMMDIRMPVLDGIEATRRLTRSTTSARVVVLTTYGLDEYVYEALRAGAAGFLLKTDPPDRIVDAVRVVAAGDALLGPETTRRLIERFLAGPPPNAPRPSALDTLTDREIDVLQQVARGLSNHEVAANLFIGEGTVKTHVARILAKLELRDRVQIVVYAYEHALVRPTTPPASGTGQ
jgi:DNA-binding NarL/FixJ family response regulator